MMMITEQLALLIMKIMMIMVTILIIKNNKNNCKIIIEYKKIQLHTMLMKEIFILYLKEEKHLKVMLNSETISINLLLSWLPLPARLPTVAGSLGW